MKMFKVTEEFGYKAIPVYYLTEEDAKEAHGYSKHHCIPFDVVEKDIDYIVEIVMSGSPFRWFVNIRDLPAVAEEICKGYGRSFSVKEVVDV